MSVPFHMALPDVGRATVARMRISVDFPAPFGPSLRMRGSPAYSFAGLFFCFLFACGTLAR
jgi:hypothetical protein